MSYQNDKRLSYKARGVMAYLMEKGIDWKGQVYNIVNASDKDGMKSVQAAVKELSNLGYITLTNADKVDGKFTGKYYEINKELATHKYFTAKKGMAWKHQYLTLEWSERRNEILERDSYTCQACGKKETTLHVHHKQYLKGKFVWESPNEDLITLCKFCHLKEHPDKIKIKRVKKR